jgi:outer membrane receptor protein involved in Fe transport
MHRTIFTSISLLLCVCLTISAFAGTTGKIAGKVISAENKQPIGSANILLVGTTLGASSDGDGSFFIINIPPGLYSMRVQCLGYAAQEVRNIRVSADITTTLNFDLQSSVLEVGAVEITETRTLIQADLTATRSIVSSESIEILPLENYEDVLRTQGGFSSDANGGLHLRGGRTGEITFLLDGVPMGNPDEGGLGGVFNNDAIKELQVLSGTFNAEYGNAQSGIVNIITKEGTQEFNGKFEVTTAQLNASPYRKVNALVTDRDPEVEVSPGQFNRLAYQPLDLKDRKEVSAPFTGSVNGYLSGPVLGIENLSFFASGKYLNEDSQLPHGYTLERSGLGKLTYKNGPAKLMGYADYSELQSFQYSHRFKYRPDLQNRLKQDILRLKLSFTHTVSPTSFYTINLARLHVKADVYVPGIPIDSLAVRELDSERLFVIGGVDLQNSSENLSYSINADYTYQFDKNNLLKTGIETKFNQIGFNGIRPLARVSDLIVQTATTNYIQHPAEFAYYIQDKLELDFLVANFGIRLDALTINTRSLTDIKDINSGLSETKTKFSLSPRVGIAFPITERVSLHVAYGHFTQYASYGSMFTGLDLIRDPQQVAKLNQPFIGNPDAQPQRTVSFEVGLQSQIGDDYRFTITSFYKDINNLLGGAGSQRSYDTLSGKIISYGYLDNVDFANSKGVEFAFGKERGEYFTCQINYMLAFAKGSNASPNIGIVNVFTGVAQRQRDFYLDFDRRHTINISLFFRTPTGFASLFEGFAPLENMSITVLSQFASGFPYTPVTDDLTVEVEPNSARQPWTSTVDLRLERTIDFNALKIILFAEGNNIFDALNPMFVNARSGKLWEDGRNMQLRADFLADPADAGLRRSIKIGLKVRW